MQWKLGTNHALVRPNGAPHTSIPRAQKPCFIPPNYLFSTPGDEYKQQGLYLSTESLRSLLYGTIALIEQLSDSASKLQ